MRWDLLNRLLQRYALPAPELFEAAPNLNRWLAVCDARPAYKRMMEELEREPA